MSLRRGRKLCRILQVACETRVTHKKFTCKVINPTRVRAWGYVGRRSYKSLVTPQGSRATDGPIDAQRHTSPMDAEEVVFQTICQPMLPWPWNFSVHTRTTQRRYICGEIMKSNVRADMSFNNLVPHTSSHLPPHNTAQPPSSFLADINSSHIPHLKR